MASSITKVKAIRIANETAEYFEGKALNRLVERVHSLLVSGEMTFDGENVRLKGKPAGKDWEELAYMLGFFGLTVDDFVKEADTAIAEGVLTFSKGRLVCVVPDWVEKLSDYCHDKGIDVDKFVEKCMQQKF